MRDQRPPSINAPHSGHRGTAIGRGVGMDPSAHQAWSRGKQGGSVTHPSLPCFAWQACRSCPHGYAWNMLPGGHMGPQSMPVTLPCQGGACMSAAFLQLQPAPPAAAGWCTSSTSCAEVGRIEGSHSAATTSRGAMLCMGVVTGDSFGVRGRFHRPGSLFVVGPGPD